MGVLAVANPLFQFAKIGGAIVPSVSSGRTFLFCRNKESRADAIGVGRRVVVRIPVVVDIGEIGTRHNIAEPKVERASNKNPFYSQIF